MKQMMSQLKFLHFLHHRLLDVISRKFSEHPDSHDPYNNSDNCKQTGTLATSKSENFQMYLGDSELFEI